MNTSLKIFYLVELFAHLSIQEQEYIISETVSILSEK